MLLVCAGAMLAFFVVNKGFAFVLHADDSENQEILTVPIQQSARVTSTYQHLFLFVAKVINKSLEIKIPF